MTAPWGLIAVQIDTLVVQCIPVVGSDSGPRQREAPNVFLPGCVRVRAEHSRFPLSHFLRKTCCCPTDDASLYPVQKNGNLHSSWNCTAQSWDRSAPELWNCFYPQAPLLVHVVFHNVHAVHSHHRAGLLSGPPRSITHKQHTLPSEITVYLCTYKTNAYAQKHFPPTTQHTQHEMPISGVQSCNPLCQANELE